MCLCLSLLCTMLCTSPYPDKHCPLCISSGNDVSAKLQVVTGYTVFLSSLLALFFFLPVSYFLSFSPHCALICATSLTVYVYITSWTDCICLFQPWIDLNFLKQNGELYFWPKQFSFKISKILHYSSILMFVS